MQTAQAQEAMDLQKQLTLKQADYEGKAAVASIPSIRANMNDLPLDAQVNIINTRTAGSTSPQAMIEKIARDQLAQMTPQAPAQPEPQGPPQAPQQGGTMNGQ